MNYYFSYCPYAVQAVALIFIKDLDVREMLMR